MYCWRILNDVNPIWSTLEQFLQGAQDGHFQWLCPSKSEKQYFVVYFVFGTIRAALQFVHSATIVALD